MQFGVLGPLEVRGHRQIIIGAHKHRSVLAALLLGANHVQSVDRLVDVVWGDRPPASARNVISVYVYNLRKIIRDLGDASTATIITRPPGYLLHVSGDEVDHLVFEQLVRDGSTAASQDDHLLAASRFRDALDLWRGPALADIDSDLIRDIEVPRLEEARLSAIEQRIESDLTLGWHAQVVAELELLANQHPFRERLLRQLMLALYRSGRRGEAVRRYQQARRALVEELGLEPGPELRMLVQAVLADDASLGVPVAEVRVTARPAAPMQIPADLADFAGRQREIEMVETLLQPSGQPAGRPLVVVSGGPGVGKSALAVTAAHRMRWRFPDGQLHADLRGSAPDAADPGDVLARFLEALAIRVDAIPEGLDERVRLFRTHVADRRLLVVLDDAGREAQVRPLLPTCGGSAALVTSRYRLAGLEGARVVELGALAHDPALALLRSVVDRPWTAAEVPAAREIVRLCGGLPLALRIAGAKLAARPHWSLATLARHLRDSDGRLARLSAGDLDVRASFRSAYDRLSPPAQRAFRLLAQLPEPSAPMWVVAALFDRGAAATEDLLDTLSQAHLLTVAGVDELGQSRFRPPPLLRDFAFALTCPAEATAALDRLLDVSLGLAAVARSAFAGDSGRWQVDVPARPLSHDLDRPAAARRDPAAWFRAERQVLRSCVRAAYAARRWSLVWRLALVQTEFFRRFELWHDWRRAYGTALYAARHARDAAATAAALDGLGELDIALGRWPAAMAELTDALALAVQTGDLTRQAYVLHALGAVHQQHGRACEAALHRHRAGEIFAGLGRVPPCRPATADAA